MIVTDDVLEKNFLEPVGERLDKFLVRTTSGLSRSRIQSLIHNGKVSIDGVITQKAGQILQPGQHISMLIPPNEDTGLLPEQIPLNIVYEDDNLIVINKPAGMVVHPAAGVRKGTLVNAILGSDIAIDGIGGENRPGIVHRLDKDTSGIILVAKNDQAHHWLQDQFKNRKVYKTYLALVDGRPPTPSGRIEASLGRDLHHRKRFTVVPCDKGREAVTEYRTLEPFRNHTLLEVHPLTGRTHQIRIHLKYIGCPIAGDKIYGYQKPTLEIKRHFLHASSIKIKLPGNIEDSFFQVGLPVDLEMILSQLRNEK